MKRLPALVAVMAALVALAPPAAATPGPPSAPEYWFDRWQVPSLWAGGARGQGVTIAEIDTGVNAKLPALAGRVLRGTDFGRHGDGRTDRQIDAFGHGTAMASIMVARPGLFGITGLAPGARILPIAVPLNGTTDGGEPDHLPQAIRYAADHGARVISMSLGSTRSPGTDTEPCPADEQDAVYHARRKGAVVLAAVGNNGPGHSAVEEPGVCLGVVSVGAVDASDTVARFSGRQPYLTLTAPGVHVPSLGRVAGTAFSGDGTSQATALSAAAVALVWSAHPRLTGRAVVARVLATLDERRSTPSRNYGYGVLNTYRAVTAAVPPSAPNPVDAAADPFLARAAAFTAPPVPKPALTRTGGTGTYTVGSLSHPTSPLVVLGWAAIAAGGVLLAVLIAAAVRRSRSRSRRRRAPAGSPSVGLPPATPLPIDPPPLSGTPAPPGSAR